MQILKIPGKSVELYECDKCKKNFIYNWECLAHEEKCMGNILKAFENGRII